MIQVEKQLKYLLCLLKIFWENSNIRLLKIQDTDQACLEKLNLSILHRVCHLVNHLKSFKNDHVKNIAKCKSDFNYDNRYRFYKRYDEFEEMSLDFKYNWIKEFNKLFTNFKNLRPKNPKMQLKKERIMKNFDELYEKYYNAHKNYYDDDELNEAKKKKIDYKQFELFDKTDKKSKQNGETNKIFKGIENEKKSGRVKTQCIAKIIALKK